MGIRLGEPMAWQVREQYSSCNSVPVHYRVLTKYRIRCLERVWHRKARAVKLALMFVTLPIFCEELARRLVLSYVLVRSAGYSGSLRS